VTTIKPLHSIASAVMDGIGKPLILIDGASSPHGFALKPSQAILLQGADVVFWVGPELTPSLAKPIASMADNATVIELMEAPGVSHLGLREGATFDSHDHDHDHGDAHDHGSAHDHDHDHGGEESAHETGGHSGHEDHAHDGEGHAHDAHDHAHDHDSHEHDAHDDETHADAHAHGEERDAHIWLNPDNGIAIAAAMAETLAKVDPDNAEAYRSNATAFADRIEALEKNIATELEPVKGRNFIVFHDAYHHFEHHFDIEASGSVTVSPEALSSADRVTQIRDRIADLDVACVFQEPQFEAKLVDVVLEGSEARAGTLDPLGTDLQNGPDLYPELLSGLAKSLADCLGSAS